MFPIENLKRNYVVSFTGKNGVSETGKVMSINESKKEVKVELFTNSKDKDPVIVTIPEKNIKAALDSFNKVVSSEKKRKKQFSPMMVEVFNFFNTNCRNCPCILRPVVHNTTKERMFRFEWNKTQFDDIWNETTVVPFDAFIRETGTTVDIVVTKPFNRVFNITKNAKTDKPIMFHQLTTFVNFMNSIKSAIKSKYKMFRKKYEKLVSDTESYVNAELNRVYDGFNENQQVIKREPSAESIYRDDKFKPYAVDCPKYWGGPCVKCKEMSQDNIDYMNSLEVCEVNSGECPCDVKCGNCCSKDCLFDVNKKMFYGILDDLGNIKTIFRVDPTVIKGEIIKKDEDIPLNETVLKVYDSEKEYPVYNVDMTKVTISDLNNSKYIGFESQKIDDDDHTNDAIVKKTTDEFNGRVVINPNAEVYITKINDDDNTVTIMNTETGKEITMEKCYAEKMLIEKPESTLERLAGDNDQATFPDDVDNKSPEQKAQQAAQKAQQDGSDDESEEDDSQSEQGQEKDDFDDSEKSEDSQESEENDDSDEEKSSDDSDEKDSSDEADEEDDADEEDEPSDEQQEQEQKQSQPKQQKQQKQQSQKQPAQEESEEEEESDEPDSDESEQSLADFDLAGEAHQQKQQKKQTQQKEKKEENKQQPKKQKQQSLKDLLTL